VPTADNSGRDSCNRIRIAVMRPARARFAFLLRAQRRWRQDRSDQQSVECAEWLEIVSPLRRDFRSQPCFIRIFRAAGRDKKLG
jgi:hypothetical protein